MTHVLRHAFGAVIVTAIAFACSTGSGGMIGPSQEECGSETAGCRPWNCLCLDGTSTSGSACVAGVCQSGAELCASRCEGHLGVEHFEPQPMDGGADGEADAEPDTGADAGMDTGTDAVDTDASDSGADLG